MTATEAKAKQPFSMLGTCARFAREEDGATAIEYSLIVSLIFLVVVSAVRAMMNSTSEMYSEINSAMN
jgi:Flp pilus assembly pilin Flp